MVSHVDVDTDAVDRAIREVAAAEVESRFRSLGDDDIHEKSPGDLVTAADRACEEELTLRLRAIADLPVVGEEAAYEDPTSVVSVASVDAAWVLDPVDGTANFVAGSPDHAVMVALVQHGRTTHAWMHLPATGSMLRAERSGGAWRDGARVRSAAPAPGAVGLLKRGYLPEPIVAALDGTALGGAAPLLRDAVHGRSCCPVDYDDVAAGVAAFAIYWRTLVWDHAAPALYATEAGLRVARPGGGEYVPGDDGVGLVVAHPDRWEAIDAMFDALS